MQINKKFKQKKNSKLCDYLCQQYEIIVIKEKTMINTLSFQVNDLKTFIFKKM